VECNSERIFNNALTFAKVVWKIKVARLYGTRYVVRSLVLVEKKYIYINFHVLVTVLDEIVIILEYRMRI